MSSKSQSESQEFRVPFSEITAPMGHAGEAVYSAAETVTRFVKQALQARKTKARERVTIRELSALDNRTLKDIGICRSEIRHIARTLAESPGAYPRVTRT